MLTVAVYRRFSDLDPLGHVNNVAYHDYLQEARMGLIGDLDAVVSADFAQIVVSQEIRHRKPLGHSPEPVRIEIGITAGARTSYTITNRLLNEEGEIAAEATTLMAVVDPASGRSIRIPEGLTRRFEPHQGPARHPPGKERTLGPVNGGAPRSWALAASALSGTLALALLQAPVARAAEPDAGPAPKASRQATPDKGKPRDVEPREAVGLIVEYAPGTRAQEAPGVPTGADEVLVTDVDVGTRIGFGLRTVEFTDAQPAAIAEAAAAQIEQDPAVISAEPDWVIDLTDSRVSTRAVQSGPPWGLSRIDQRALPIDNSYYFWSTGVGVRAYIVDTGILSTHTEFTGRMASGYSSIADGGGTEDCHGHGTHVAGTVGGTTYGVAKEVTLVPVRVLNCEGSGSSSTVIAGLNWVVADHDPSEAAVVNMSLGGGLSSELDAAVEAVIADGVTVVVASGNSGDDACYYSPARVPSAITVNASDEADDDAYFSNYGSCTDLYAPGVGILSAGIASTTATLTLSGTSMAAPHVAGVVARLLQLHPGWTTAEMWSSINAATTSVNFGLGDLGDPNKLLYIEPNDQPPPTTPSSLTVTPTHEALTVAWGAPASGPTPTHYDVQYTSDDSTWVTDDTTVSTGATLDALTPGIGYRVRVRSVNAAGASAWITDDTVRLPLAPTVPGITSMVTVVPDDDTTITVTWALPASNGGRAIDYYAVRHSHDDSTWVSDDTTVDLTRTITGLLDDSTYYVQVAAINVLGQGPWSSSSSPISPRVLIAPSSPQSLTVTPGDGALSGSWLAPADSGGRSVTSYAVEYSPDDSTWAPLPPVAGLSTTVPGLANGTTYSVRIAAVSSIGQGAWATASGMPVAPPPPPPPPPPSTGGGGGTVAPPPPPVPVVAKPAAPMSPQVTPGNAAATLTWSPPDDTGGGAITSYEMELVSESSSLTFTSEGPGWEARGLVNGEAYRARVAAVNSAGTGAWSTWSEEVTPRGPAEGPRNVVAVAGDASARIAWLPPGDDGGSDVTGYVVEVTSSAGLRELVVSDTATVLVGLTNAAWHTIRIAAETDFGRGAWSTSVTVTPRASRVTAPINVSATRAGRQVRVAWSTPTTGRPLTYAVSVSLDGKPFLILRATRETRVSLTVASRVRVVRVRVAAVDSYGRGPFSSPVQAR